MQVKEETSQQPVITLPPLVGCKFKKTSYMDLGKKRIVYPKNSIAVIPKPTKPGAWDAMLKNKNFDIRPVDDMFTRYSPQDPGSTVFSHQGAGIGDIISFSAIAAYLKDTTLQVFIDPAKACIIDWFERKPNALKHYYEPITLNAIGKSKGFRRLFLEWAAMTAGRQNWFLGYFNRMGVEKVNVEYLRPRLQGEKFYGIVPPKEFSRSVLISHRSSCQMRSGRFCDFYEAVKDVYPKHKVFVFDQDLSAEDRIYLQESAQKVTVIDPLPLDKYLETLSYFSFVVTIDSAAIHFREGIGLPAVAAFGAMEVCSRTNHYRYTRSFDAKSECQYQPCYLHETTKGMQCKKMREMVEQGYSGATDIAPCLMGDLFKAQLIDFMKGGKV